MKNLIPKPADGRVRALFTDGAQSSLAQAGQASLMGPSRGISPFKHNYYQSAAASNAVRQNNSAMYVIDDEHSTIGQRAEVQESAQEQEKEMKMLDLINRVQMF